MDTRDLCKLFAGRTFSWFKNEPVDTETLRRVYNLARWAPTSANGQPLRVVFAKSQRAKERLLPYVHDGNVDKVRAAPVTAIIAYDGDFHQHLPRLFPHEPSARNWFADPINRHEHAFRNGTLQGAYFMLAARACGLDVGPMSGFDPVGVRGEFWPELSEIGGPPDGACRVNFLCNLGYGDRSRLHPQLPRLGFEHACRVV